MDPRISVLLRVVAVSSQLTSEQAGSMLGLSEARTLRLFKREVGKSFHQYLLETRMGRAAELLRTTVRPIKSIAFDCGYSDISNFYRDFKKVHGTSPGQLRLKQMSLWSDPESLVMNPNPLFASADARIPNPKKAAS